MADLFVSGGIVTALEAAAVAVGRLDAALAGNPLRRAWTFWSELDAARRHAEADGRRVDLFRLAAHLHGLPLRLGDTASAPERGREIAGLNYAIDLRSWMAAPDPEQVRLREIALDSLRAAGPRPAGARRRGPRHAQLAGGTGQPARHPHRRAAVPARPRDHDPRAGRRHRRRCPAGRAGRSRRLHGALSRDGPARGCGGPRPAADDGAGVAGGPDPSGPPRRRPVEQPAAGGSRSAGRLAAAQHLRSGRGAGLLGRGRIADAGLSGPTRGRRRGDRSDRAGRPAALRPQAPAADPGRDDGRSAPDAGEGSGDGRNGS